MTFDELMRFGWKAPAIQQVEKSKPDPLDLFPDHPKLRFMADGSVVRRAKEILFVPNGKTRRKKIQPFERLKVFQKTGGQCYLCGCILERKTFTVDHRIPLARGGTYALSNLWPSCWQCNHKKGDSIAGEMLPSIAAEQPSKCTAKAPARAGKRWTRSQMHTFGRRAP